MSRSPRSRSTSSAAPTGRDEPTTLVARYLFPTERYRGEWKRHWIAVLRSAGIITLHGVLGIWVTNLRVEPRPLLRVTNLE
jgi:hypothetical protein